jgi:serine/threonine-protein kinase
MGDGPIPWERAAILGAQIADALAAAHGLGIVHRDLKPDNVLLERRDDGSELVKVLDFGIARVPNDAEKAPQGADTHRPLTKVGTVMGTPGYMAPEQALGDTVDHRADLYSLGVILWEMIAGRYLYEGELSSIVVKQLSETAPALGSVVDDPSIPEELELLVEELLGKSASERPSDAASVRDRLQQLVFRASVGNDISGLSALPYVARPTPTAGSRRISQITGATPVLPPPPTGNGKLWVGIGVGIAVAAVAVFAALELTEADLIGGVSGEASEVVTATLLPPAVQGAIDTLVLSGDASARTAAADAILSYLPVSDLPPYAVALAELEKSDGCRPRRLALKKVQEIRDPAALPYLKRLRALPRRGCGPRNNRDCYACIRGDILDAYNALTAAEEAAVDVP